MIRVRMVIGGLLILTALATHGFAGRPIADDPTNLGAAEQLQRSRELRWLQGEKDRLTTSSERLKSKASEFLEESNAIKKETLILATQRKQLNALQFRCPLGNPLSECSHHEEHRQFTRAWNLCNQDLNEKGRRLQFRIQRVITGDAAVKNARQQCASDLAAVTSRLQKYSSAPAKTGVTVDSNVSRDQLIFDDSTPKQSRSSVSGAATGARAGITSGSGTSR